MGCPAGHAFRQGGGREAVLVVALYHVNAVFPEDQERVVVAEQCSDRPAAGGELYEGVRRELFNQAGGGVVQHPPVFNAAVKP